MKNFLRLLILFFLLPIAASATQSSLVTGTFQTTSPYSGLSLVNNINTAMTALSSNNSGSSAPAYLGSGMQWWNSSSNLLEFSPDGTNSYPMGYTSGGWIAMSAGFKQLAVTTTGSSNAYVIPYSPEPVAYVTGQIYMGIANFSNTSAATVNFNTIGATAIKKYGGAALVSGDIANGQVMLMVYDGTYFQLLNPVATSVQSTAATAFTATQSVTPTTLSISTATFTPTFGTSNTYKLQLVHASCPCTIANPSGTIVPGTDIVIEVQQSSSGSDVVGTWGTYYKFSGGVAPTLSTGASADDMIPCHVSTSTDLLCGFIGNFSL
jgi:hypothetical protein